MKKVNKILSAVIIFMMLFAYIPSIVYGISEIQSEYKIKKTQTSYWAYNSGTKTYKRINKFSVDTGGWAVGGEANAAYCLRADASFSGSSATYNKTYNMKSQLSDMKDKKSDWDSDFYSSFLKNTKIKANIQRTYYKSSSGSTWYTHPILNVTEGSGSTTYTNYNAVLWILDNMYVPMDDSSYNKSFKKQLYEEVFADAIEKKSFATSEVTLTDEQIQIVQQCAIWYFTNSDQDKYHTTTLPTMKTGSTFSEAKNVDSTTQRYMQALYVYLLENAMKNSDEYGYDDDLRKVTLATYVDRVALCTISGKYSTQQPVAVVTRQIPNERNYKVVVRKYKYDSSTNSNELINDNVTIRIGSSNRYRFYYKNI